ncbi:biopolymer transporter ExbD [Sphingomonas sp. 2R-10]|uniref:biopolymer transporter ExbD n=1 Tax=Sphingomonas sp. 2R-10 TaxID=3045148 RepID=UPI000F76AB0A|nr:biopolymer transporter ExbD [Sphingomonas sp. 2R-10]MDJ0277530.1 biopolymer transporter ExbD [Sphingomonas sp. 2R-10]
MKRGLLSSAAPGLMAAPVSAETPLRIEVAMAADATARVTIGSQSFVLPDEQERFAAALNAMPDKDRPVVVDVTGRTETPYRVFGGILYLAQSAGFQRVSFVAEPPAG